MTNILILSILYLFYWAGLQAIEIPIDADSGSIDDDEIRQDFPPTGFIQSTFVGTDVPFLFKTTFQIKAPALCQTLEFVNLPNPNPSPFMKGPIFQLMPDPVNNKFVWTNGQDIISFIPSSDDGGYGTWIVGIDAGVDAGYVYIKPNGDTLTPLSLESDKVTWFWLNNKNWIAQPNTKLLCRDESVLPINRQSFFSIEYFDIESKTDFQSVFIPLYNVLPSFIRAPNPDGSKEPIADTAIEALYFDISVNAWRSLTNLKVLAAMGEPNLILDPNSKNKVGHEIGHLVNVEHAHYGWRFTLRYSQLTPSSTGINEVCVIYSSLGCQSDVCISSLSTSQLQLYTDNTSKQLSLLKTGDFVWLWYNIGIRPASGVISEPALDLSDDDKNLNRNDEVLLECIAVSNNTAVFIYYPSDRVNTMHQKVLHRDTSFVIMHRELQENDVVSIWFEIDGVELVSLGVYTLGSDLVSFVKSYLVDKEVSLPHMSSCYLYHAAVSLPRPLVYGELTIFPCFCTFWCFNESFICF